MHILIAPDSFKESLSARQVAEALRKGFSQALPHASFDLMPVGDGGEGTMAALIDGLSLEIKTHQVTGALGQPVNAHYASKENLAVFEMADICGLEKVPKNARNPLRVTTKGVGEMLAYLTQKGFTQIMVGVGGSSSNDGGIGMAAGLGYRFLDKQGKELEAVGANLGKISSILPPKENTLQRVSVTIITDVTNPLCGKEGASYVFGGQKGLPSQDFESIDQSMRKFYQLANPDIFNLAGAGAGGGMAAGLVTFAGGKLLSGIDAVLDILNFDQRVKKADLVVVGEGRMDKQSLSGKAPVGVALRTPDDIPVIAICGSLKDDLPDFPSHKIQAAFPIIASVDSLENTLAQAQENLRRTALNLGNLVLITKNNFTNER
ncbi:glycerate kinase [Streptococcus henryi]|uniref:Glycerate kinase n=1 Tax=Streptococcus henryi TaxID=439219 RepID=A0A1G6CRF1_9STRE|nr:glycerate kinase [Streptococcus henryi]SDB35423.1 glycerate kinase [Streptococcus henryi]